MATIDQAEFETVRDVLAGAYEDMGKANLPYANVHSALNQLSLGEIASPYARYIEVCQQYQAAAQQIRETQTADQLRAYMLEVAQPANPPEQMETVEPR